MIGACCFGVAILIFSGMSLDHYEFLEKEAIELMYGVQGVVKKRKNEFEKTYRISIIAGVILCILCVVPLMIAISLNANYLMMILCVDILLLMVLIAVFLFICFGLIHSSYQKLLQQGDYTQENKSLNKKTAYFPPFYWTLVTAFYLAMSFITNQWKTTWIVWPVAGVLFVALHSFIKMLVNRK